MGVDEKGWWEMSAEKKLKTLRKAYVENAGHTFDCMIQNWTESPIEELLLAQMMVSGWGSSQHPQRSWCDTFEELREHVGPGRTHQFLVGEGCGCIAVWQCPITCGSKKYRIDLAMVGYGAGGVRVKIAVELDGHDFHEKTKEQARKDKSRDRALVAAGWTVLRFTGSEVYAGPDLVLDEIVALANQRCGWGLSDYPALEEGQ